MSVVTVGSLLASIATSIGDGLRIMTFADKRQWGPDEHEQMRLLEETLDDAKKDFQELSQLVNGQFYYENDRKRESLEELQELLFRFDFHIQNFKDWVRTGGPINPTWARDTTDLRRKLHRAQCRAARRIYTSEQEGLGRCLGAFLVYRKQRAWANSTIVDEMDYQTRHLEELAICNSVGKFERFGDQDIAFVCNFCDGYIIWDDLEAMPPIRAGQDTATSPISPLSPTTQTPNWQATGYSTSAREEKTVVFAPIAIANHAAPQGGFLAKLICPYCEDFGEVHEQDDEEETRYVPDEDGFDDLHEFQEHLAWQHTATTMPVAIPPLPAAPSNCSVM